MTKLKGDLLIKLFTFTAKVSKSLTKAKESFFSQR